MKKLVIIILLSFISNILLTMVYPNIFSHFVTYYLKFDFPVFFQIIVCFTAIVLLTSYLFFEISRISFSKAVIKTSLMYLLFIVFALIMSVLSGFLAELIYSIFKNTKTLDEIKRIIDITIQIIYIIILPLFVSLFWNIAYCNRYPIKKFFKGLISNPIYYFELLGIMAILLVLGMLMNLIPSGIVGSTIKTVLLTMLGTIALYVTEVIYIKKKENHERLEGA